LDFRDPLEAGVGACQRAVERLSLSVEASELARRELD
jgi:hypothetical protein